MVQQYIAQIQETELTLEWVQWIELNPWIFRTYTNEPMDFMAKHI